MANQVLHYAGQKFTIKDAKQEDIADGFESPGHMTLDTESHGRVTFVTGPGIPVFVTTESDKAPFQVF